MDLIERELLDAVARDRDDEAALSVLADYWIQYGDEARGTFVQLQCGRLDPRIELAADEHARRSCTLALDAGFAEADLVLDRGVLRWPLVIAAGEPLDEQPDLFRLSPRYYRERARESFGYEFEVFAGEAVTPMRTGSSNEHRVAIKACLEHADELSRARLDREYAILLRLRHPNIVTTPGLAVRRTGLALVTNWAGLPLRTLLNEARKHRHALGVSFALSVAVQLCDALEALDHARIVHGEINDGHVLVGQDGTVTVIDFSYVEGPAPPVPRRRVSATQLGRSLALRYLSPEQARGHKLDARSDLFSAMVVVCELVACERLIHGDMNDFELLTAIRDCQLDLPALPPRIAEVMQRTLVPREQRIASAAELRDALAHAARLSSVEIGRHVIAQRLCELGVAA